MKFVVFLIKTYQFIWHPIKNGFADAGIVLNKCYFSPSCSNYAIMALQKYPFKKAVKAIGNRLIRCQKRIGDNTDYP